ncbi:hypothetical protein NUH86_11015 [Sphingobium sp. JS3065]|uniref:hypothetical protein n=1 Tax=Sphingobium sp. JS3065 TaxID=2970925 RepID=UPI0022647526|nr:hypothetical protein [Sphingobium sp. JS3065]UZW54065.1 hypothetical protein NUH86_11015 [Sphingobium sp. JS3065]
MDDLSTKPLSAAQLAETEFDLKAAREEVVERLRNQMLFAEKALAALLLANGGALIGLFTFIGNVVGKADAPLKFSTGHLWGGFACFSLGVALVLITHLFAFFSQLAFYNQAANEMWRHQRTLSNGALDRDQTEEAKFHARGNRSMKVGILTLSASLICFVLGAGLSLAGVLPA